MIPLFKVFMAREVDAPLLATLHSGYIGQGPRVEDFELALAPWVGGRRPLALNSGTSALHLALRLAGAGPDTEVITTPMTCTATNMPILERGAKVVWADVDPTTGNISPKSVREKVTKKTKAVIAVHWGGYPCDLDELDSVCRAYNLRLIEDAAHAFSAEYKGQKIGARSDFTCFSFQAIKHLTTIDGGALVCESDGDYKRGKLLRWYGIDRDGQRQDLRCEAEIHEYGYKFHMNDVNAIIGLAQLPHVERILALHRRNAEYYRDRLKDLKNVTLLDYKSDRLSSYWLFTILVQNRDAFVPWMAEHGIMASKVHVRNDLHRAFASSKATLPGVDLFYGSQVSIPVGWWVMPEDREKIVEAILEWDKR
jgi:dTDP-4-amino-4,6-dideoxygalactose transaminase